MRGRRITLLIDLPSERPFHVATIAALRHAIEARGADVAVDVAPTDRIGALGDGVVMGPGTPYRDPAAAERAIARARQEGIPLVAT